MKNPFEITKEVLIGMDGIGGIPTNQQFYNEFNDRLRAALSLSEDDNSLPSLDCIEKMAANSLSEAQQHTTICINDGEEGIWETAFVLGYQKGWRRQ